VFSFEISRREAFLLNFKNVNKKPTCLLFFLSLIFLLNYQYLTPQQKTTISGKVPDKTTGEAVPFVNVFCYGSQIGTTTDFEGRYKLSSYDPSDSLVFSYISYKTVVLPVALDQTQVINVALEPDLISLQEIVVTAKGGN